MCRSEKERRKRRRNSGAAHMRAYSRIGIIKKFIIINSKPTNKQIDSTTSPLDDSHLFAM